DPGAPVLIRINGPKTPWFREDLAFCTRPGVAGVVLPKTESVDDVRAVAEAVGGEMPILPLVETARGIRDAEAIAQTGCVERLLFGALDLQLDLGIGGEGEE